MLDDDDKVSGDFVGVTGDNLPTYHRPSCQIIRILSHLQVRSTKKNNFLNMSSQLSFISLLKLKSGAF